MSQICSVAAAGKKALDDIAAAAVSAAAVSQYAQVVEMIRNATGIDINQFFNYIAYLVVLCWVGNWLNEIFNFLLNTIPKFFKNLLRGKLNFCLLDCDNSSSASAKSSKSSASSSFSGSSASLSFC